jgi:predicted HTH domain antitoxin
MNDSDQDTDMAEVSRDAADDTLATAIGQYVLGEISLGKAAENAGMTRWEFEDRLDAAGFDALYGPRSAQEFQDEVDTALDVE